MFDFIVDHQLNILLALSGACGICGLFVYISRTLTDNKKRDLMLLELSAMGLLLFDRGATIFDGDPGMLAFWMVRVCNSAVFLLTLTVVFFYNMYLKDVIRENDEILVMPKMLDVTGVLCFVGIGMVIFAICTGLYFSFDENNTYQRAPAFFVSYILPIIIPVLQLTFVFQYYKKIHKGVRLSLLLFPLVPMIASILQFLMYGLMLTDLALAFMSILLYVMALLDVNATLERTRKKEMAILMREEKTIFNLFRQIVTAFVSAIDAKDSYTKGHAARTATYAKRLAELAGKDEDECEVAYFSALLHDVGKISLPDSLLNKRGRLNEEETKMFDGHVIRGRDILSGITEFPYLQEAAHYHHEWYDGTGFPDGLAGEDIPDLARLVTLADAYDAMSSVRADREPLPQQTIREEIVKDTGRRFDPGYAKLMLMMIDEDKDYNLREHQDFESDDLESELTCESYRTRWTKGIAVTEEIGRVSFRCEPTELKEGEFSSPTILLFDALDGRIHTVNRSIAINRYTEYGEVWFDGHMICTRARNMKMNTQPYDELVNVSEWHAEKLPEENEYRIEAVRVGDHVRLRLLGEGLATEVITALPDSSGSLFLSLTGEHCHITEIAEDGTGVILKEGDIPRIADEVTYINRMVGDVPNIQVDSYLSKATEGMAVTDGMEIAFHTMTLPAANLVWHCPSLVFFKSDDHRVHGPNYDELVIIRLDGESIESGGKARSVTEMRQGDDFENWDAWKEINKKGYECKVYLRRLRNRIVLVTENAGISIRSTIYTENADEDIRVALTGDQCALTDIRFIA